MKIIVIGESCTDVFVYCDALRLAPDFPVPVLEEKNKVYNVGMAANVRENILVFKDCDIVTNRNYSEVTKTRYVHSKTNHTFIRVDAEPNYGEFDIDDDSYMDYDIVVISDYNKGFLSEKSIRKICNKHPTVFLDTKKVLGEWANGAFLIKINDYEYKNSKPYIDANIRDKIIRTCGGDGCYYQDIRYPVERQEVKDSSGAGDSFLAALVVGYSDTGDIIQSIKFANLKASEVVKHKGVTLISKS